MKGERFVFGWANNPRRAELKGRVCEIVVEGRRMNSVLVEFLDTHEKVVVSRRALKGQRGGGPHEGDRLWKP